MDFTYSGKWGVQKEEYNLYYMRDRYYSSELHRFLSLDKDQGDLYRPSTLNPYAYVGNDPINFIDPSGMTAVNIANALKNTVINEDGSLNWGGLFELGKLALSFTPIGWAIDLYDLGKSILEFDWTWGGLADIGLNVVGFLPGIGDLAKGSRLGKNAIKTVDAVADVTDSLNDARKAIKRTDALVDAGKAAKNVGNTADAIDTANDAGKALKNGDSLKSSDDVLDVAKGTKKIVPLEEFGETNIKNGSLSNYEARKWYLEQETKIPSVIDESLPLEQQARQAFDARNKIRTKARDLMEDRELAKSLNVTDPNKVWGNFLEEKARDGLSGDELYKYIIESSQRSRKKVNESFGLE